MAMLLIGEASFATFAAGGQTITMKAYSAYKGAVIEWLPVSGAASYNVYRNGSLRKKNVTEKAFDNKNLYHYYDRTGLEGGGNYTYRVDALDGNGAVIATASAARNAVSPMFIGITFRRNHSLKAHDGSGARHTFRKGQRVKAHSFKFGQYIFRYGGHIYHVNYDNVKNFTNYTSRYYGTNRRYTNREAEHFVNTANVDSDSPYLIWASLYTQRMYVFKGARGRWKLATSLNWNGVKGYTWQISSGKATTPSPASLYFATQRRQRRKNGVNYLTYYHSMTSLHGTVGNQSLNDLRSGGCIRMADKYAGLIYNKMPIHTRLSVY